MFVKANKSQDFHHSMQLTPPRERDTPKDGDQLSSAQRPPEALLSWPMYILRIGIESTSLSLHAHLLLRHVPSFHGHGMELVGWSFFPAISARGQGEVFIPAIMISEVYCFPQPSNVLKLNMRSFEFNSLGYLRVITSYPEKPSILLGRRICFVLKNPKPQAFASAYNVCVHFVLCQQ